MLNENLIGEVVSCATVGGEVVGRLKVVRENGVVLENPCSVIPSSSGDGGLHPGVCLTGKANPETAVFYESNIITLVESSDEVKKVWQQATTGIILQ